MYFIYIKLKEFITMKTLLITGGSGFLGSKIIEVYKENFYILAPTHSEMDITNDHSVMEYFSKTKPDFVIHCAAISDTGRCQREPELSHLVNVTGSENIAKAAKNFHAKCIMCSSDQVYCGSPIGIANKESDSICPHNVYGKDKAYTENSCLAINPDTVHLRLAWMYDSKVTDSSRNDFLKMLKDSILFSKELSLPVNDTRGIADVWEVVDNLIKTFSLPGGVYNFGSANNMNTYEMTLSIFDTLKFNSALLKKITYDQPRNLSMSQAKINEYNIFFTNTKEQLIHFLKEDFHA